MNFLCMKTPPNIWSIELFVGSVQLKIVKCRFNLEGISFLPPPG